MGTKAPKSPSPTSILFIFHPALTKITTSMKQFSNHSLILLWIRSKIPMKPPTKVFFDILMFKDKYHQIKTMKAWREAFSKLKGQEVAITLLMTIKQIMGCNVCITKDK
jgi:hypothetical protein